MKQKKCRCGLLRGHGGPCGQPNHPKNREYNPREKDYEEKKPNPKKQEKKNPPAE